MFKIPDWGNDIPKSNVDVSKLLTNKNKKKTSINKPSLNINKNETKIIKANKQKRNVNGIGKPKNTFIKKINGYVKLSRDDHINNRILKRNLNKSATEVSEETSTVGNAKNQSTQKNKSLANGLDLNNQMKNKILKRKQKVKNNITNETNSKNGKSKVILEKKVNNTKSKKVAKKRLNNGSVKNANDENGIDIQSFNTDELDKVLVNAKRKKLNDKIKNDDKEEVLFGNKFNNDEIIASKKEQKMQKQKEKIKEVLKRDSNRNIIKTSGDKLRMRMLERLKAAQFRYLNEQLYTSTGTESQELFKSDPAAFQVYHEGYQQQVKKWPINPLDIIIKRIAKMPKTHVIADMGCGEAALSRRVSQRVHSFDLVARTPEVHACDMARTPLLAASTDVVVYCLALMGTDLTRYLLEANRVLKIGGHLLIAEVESRFDNPETFSSDVQRLGFSLKNLDRSHKVFIFMEFNKVRDPPSKKNKLPELTLKPCLYKRR
ncbi:uncharacterized protein [Epargyreus clarus]|uniref:uncharacterized protein n=1 Tax=Epargyreus clarus TaxID=520877 RepID=UPI003C2E63EE